jgi:propanol-preferring alcohol dehydrogenase
MRAMVLDAPAPIASGPLTLRSLPEPEPAAGELLVAVTACGVCRTDLHVVEGELPFPGRPLVPGHQAVGRVLALGAGVLGFEPGERVGVGWVHRFCGACEHCLAGRENLCLAPTFTGYDVDGGYAERLTVPAAFAHRLPAGLGGDVAVAPLLCAGIIGYRALKRAGLRPGDRLALYGFGASAHLALQLARAWGCEVYVVSREADARERAMGLGAAWTGAPGEAPPCPVDAAVTFAPVGAPIPEALAALRRGGTLAIAGISLDAVPSLDYERHLFQERQLVSVTANTRADARELLDLAARLPLNVDAAVWPLEAANAALARLKAGRVGAQAAVLAVGG